MLLMEIWSGELSELAVFEWLWYPVGNKKKIKFKNYLELIVLIFDCWFVFSILAKKFHVSVQPCNIL